MTLTIKQEREQINYHQEKTEAVEHAEFLLSNTDNTTEIVIILADLFQKGNQTKRCE